MTKVRNIGGGLVKLPYDGRDFSLGGTFGTLKREDLPHGDFTVSEPLVWKDQGSSDLCSSFALSEISEDQENVELSPEFTFAMTKKSRGEYLEWGADLRSTAKSAVKFGFLKQSDSPYKIGETERDFLANWENWNEELVQYAITHKKQAYFSVDGSLDVFDNLRSALWKFKDEKRSILTGALWRSEWTYAPNGVIPKEYSDNGFGHAFKIYGQKVIDGELYLVAQLSNGTDIGDKGKFYFPRAVVNKEFTYGCFMFKDLTVEDLKNVLQKTRLPFFTRIKLAFRDLFYY